MWINSVFKRFKTSPAEHLTDTGVTSKLHKYDTGLAWLSPEHLQECSPQPLRASPPVFDHLRMKAFPYISLARSLLLFLPLPLVLPAYLRRHLALPHKELKEVEGSSSPPQGCTNLLLRLSSHSPMLQLQFCNLLLLFCFEWRGHNSIFPASL